MAEKLYKVWNHNNYDIGVKFTNGTERNIRAHSFFPMPRVEIDYLSAISTVFEKNRLTIEDPDEAKQILEENGIITENNPYFDADEDIKKRLRASTQNIEKWLKGIDDVVLLGRISDVAKSVDLPASKMKLIEAKLETARV